MAREPAMATDVQADLDCRCRAKPTAMVITDVIKRRAAAKMGLPRVAYGRLRAVCRSRKGSSPWCCRMA